MASERPPARSMKDPNELGNTKSQIGFWNQKKLKKKKSRKNTRNYNYQSLYYTDMSVLFISI